MACAAEVQRALRTLSTAFSPVSTSPARCVRRWTSSARRPARTRRDARASRRCRREWHAALRASAWRASRLSASCEAKSLTAALPCWTATFAVAAPVSRAWAVSDTSTARATLDSLASGSVILAFSTLVPVLTACHSVCWQFRAEDMCVGDVGPTKPPAPCHAISGFCRADRYQVQAQADHQGNNRMPAFMERHGYAALGSETLRHDRISSGGRLRRWRYLLLPWPGSLDAASSARGELQRRSCCPFGVMP